MVNSQLITNLIAAIGNKFEKLSNKKNDISGTTASTDTSSYPTVKAAKDYFVAQVSGKGLSTNDYTDSEKTKLSGISIGADKTSDVTDNALDSTSENPVQNKVIKSALDSKANVSDLATVATSGDYDDLTDKPTIPSKTSDLTNDSNFVASGSLASVATSGSYTDLTNKPSIPSKTSDLTNDSSFVTSSSLADVATSGSYTDLEDTPNLATVATSGSYTDLDNKPDLTELAVTVEKQASAEEGYLTTYHVKQNGSKVGASINIPRDFLVKSASLQTCSTEDSPVTGYEVGDKYIDFVINTKTTSGASNEHLYVLVSDLIDTYTADESTLTLDGTEFGVKAGGITSTELASAINTSLGYADDYHNSPASSITTANISAWNSKSNLTTNDVDSEIEGYLSELITQLNAL